MRRRGPAWWRGKRLPAPALVAGLTIAWELGGVPRLDAVAVAVADDNGSTTSKVTLRTEQTVGDLAYIANLSDLRVEGVGLVIGLDGTGSDVPPSLYRTALLNEMRKARVENPEAILASSATAAVVVRMKLPTGATRDESYDVEVEAVPGSATTSLAGGRLLRAELKQVMMTEQGQAEGKVQASASGAILADEKTPRKGVIPGGGRSKTTLPYTILIKEAFRSGKTAALLQGAINTRFQQRNGRDDRGVALAKSDRHLELILPRIYRNNPERFFQVVKLVPLVTSEAIVRKRIDTWGADLIAPETSGLAALRLEALGAAGRETLKKGLASPSPTARFFAAEALAYLGDDSGVDVLAEAAVVRPEFRSQALRALASMDQAPALLRLRKLMGHSDPALRYGAFDALRRADPFDPSLGRVAVFDTPAEQPWEEDEVSQEDSLRWAMDLQRPRRPTRPQDPFALHVVDCEGPPLIHVSRTHRAEIVLFGRGQMLETPMVLNCGPNILINAADGDTQAQISRIVPGAAERRTLSSLDLATVIRTLAQFGATYPEITSTLDQARHRQNLAATLVFDAQPTKTADYDRALMSAALPPERQFRETAGTAVGSGPAGRLDEGVTQAGAEAPTSRRPWYARLNPLAWLRRARTSDPIAQASARSKDTNPPNETPPPAKLDDQVSRAGLERVEGVTSSQTTVLRNEEREPADNERDASAKPARRWRLWPFNRRRGVEKELDDAAAAAASAEATVRRGWLSRWLGWGRGRSDSAASESPSESLPPDKSEPQAN